jgi:dTMP kinase
LLLLNASRAQLVREIIRPALARGETVICDRFYHSTLAYQGYGRGLDLDRVRQVIDLAVGETRPQRVLLLRVPVAVSEARRNTREAASPGQAPTRDRMEQAGRDFFGRVERGFDVLAGEEPDRIRVIDATRSIEAVAADVWDAVEPLLQPGVP